MIKLMVEEFIFMLMVLGTVVNGLMICSMVKEKNVGQTAAFTMVSIFKERSMDVGCIVGVMVVNTMVNGVKIK